MGVCCVRRLVVVLLVFSTPLLASTTTTATTTTTTTTKTSALPQQDTYSYLIHHPDQQMNISALYAQLQSHVQCCTHNQTSSPALLHALPTALHALRVYYVINSYDMRQFSSLLGVLYTLTQYCEFGWYVRVVVQTTVTYNSTSLKAMAEVMLCHRTGSVVELTTQTFPASIKLNLCKMHRPLFLRERNNFDIFIYGEDDMIVRVGHILLYLWEVAMLPSVWLPGFLRYQTVGQELRTLPFEDFFHKFCTVVRVRGQWYWHPVNTHQAFTLVTRGQLEYLSEKCAYLDVNRSEPSDRYVGVREHLSSLQLFGPECGIRKVIPMASLAYFLKFVVYHYSRSKEMTFAGSGGSSRRLDVFFEDVQRCIRRAFWARKDYLVCTISKKRTHGRRLGPTNTRLYVD